MGPRRNGAADGRARTNWTDSTATQIYTVYDFHHIIADEIISRGAAEAGLIWQFCRPPVEVLDYEMDVRGVRLEITLAE